MSEMNENLSNEKKSNGLGLAGFIVALVALILSWIPTIGWVLGAIALILSLIGLSKKPKGMAIAGTVIAIIALAIGIYITYEAYQVVSAFGSALKDAADSLKATGALDSIR